MWVSLSASLKSGSHSIPGFSAHFSQSTCYLPFIPLQNRKTVTHFIVLHEVLSHRQPVPGIASVNPR